MSSWGNEAQQDCELGFNVSALQHNKQTLRVTVAVSGAIYKEKTWFAIRDFKTLVQDLRHALQVFVALGETLVALNWAVMADILLVSLNDACKVNKHNIGVERKTKT